MQQLLVEGKDDLHVVKALCIKHGIAETFSVVTPDGGPGDDGGIDKLLASIPVRLKQPRLRTLGILLDADENISNRWRAVIDRLTAAGYLNLPEYPESTGTIITPLTSPKIGIWLMPDNHASGMLGHFKEITIQKESSDQGE